VNIQKIVIKKGLDAHCHFRTGKMLASVGNLTARQFCRAVAMPNTVPPIETADDAENYRNEIAGACGRESEPIMAIMLTKKTTPKIVSEAGKCGVKVLKYIPRGVSTNSEESISLGELPDFYPVLQAAQDVGMIFSGHWESLRDHKGELPEIKREEASIVFLDKVVHVFPGLKIIVEHASTRRMIEYVRQCPLNVKATLTVHHALLTYKDVCDDMGRVINPHNYCKPIAKRMWDVAAVAAAMISGDRRFFFGSDNAPHLLSAKKKTPPNAGIFNPFALCMLCWIFETYGALDKLHGFITAGEKDYGLAPCNETITLVKEDQVIPESYPCADDVIVPFMAGKTVPWKITD
jgi:dihydroorotase